MRYSIFKSAYKLFFTNIFLGAAIFILGALVVRFFGEDIRGLIAYFINLGPILATIGGLGTINAFIYLEKNNKLSKNLIYKNLIQIIPILIFIGVIHSIYFYNYQNQNFLFALVITMIPLLYYCTLLLKGWSLSKKLIRFFTYTTSAQIVGLVCLLFFAESQVFLSYFIFTILLEFFIIALLFLYFLKNKITFSNEHNNEIFNDFKTKNYLSNILTVINSRADIVLLSIFYNFELVGLYVIAKSIASQLNLVANSINSLLYGHFLSVQDNKNDFRRILFYLAIVVVLLSLLIIIFGKGFISLFFGESYSYLSELLNILVIGTAIYCISQPFNSLFLSRNKAEFNSISILISLLPYPLFLLYFYDLYGLLGIGYAFVFSNFLLISSRFYFYGKIRSK